MPSFASTSSTCRTDETAGNVDGAVDGAVDDDDVAVVERRGVLEMFTSNGAEGSAFACSSLSFSKSSSYSLSSVVAVDTAVSSTFFTSCDVVLFTWCALLLALSGFVESSVDNSTSAAVVVVVVVGVVVVVVVVSPASSRPLTTRSGLKVTLLRGDEGFDD